MEIRVYDSPTCLDRYTVVILGEDGNYDFYAMSERPSHPQGINMYCGSSNDGYIEGPHLGRLLGKVPDCIRSAAELRASPT